MSLMISCKEATELAIKNNMESLGFLERLKLRMHMAMCRFCKLFEKQNKIIDEAAAHLDEVAPSQMTDSAKKKILEKILN